MGTPQIHPNAIVESNEIGEFTRIWAFVHILKGAKIGKNCNVCDHCYIEYGVHVGDNVTIKCGVYLWEGITIENDVFIGPNVVFTNDLRPRSKQYIQPQKTIIKRGASIGANSTILAGHTIGEFAMTGIGSVVTKDVPAFALVYGNPAKQVGWVDEEGNKLKQIEAGIWINPHNTTYLETPAGLKRV
jgi:acetyltransferase-like isoleucine patch superfamily enzyme